MRLFRNHNVVTAGCYAAFACFLAASGDVAAVIFHALLAVMHARAAWRELGSTKPE